MDQLELFFGFNSDRGVRTIVNRPAYQKLHQARLTYSSPIDWEAVLKDLVLPDASIATFVSESYPSDIPDGRVTGSYADMQILVEHSPAVMGANQIGVLYLPIVPRLIGSERDPVFVATDDEVCSMFGIKPDALPELLKRAA